MRALWRSLLRFLPLPLAVVLVNLIVDPVRVAGGDSYERGIASMVLAGQSVTNIVNPKDAAFQHFVIDGLPRGPEVIVLGSSRSRLIHGRYFGTRSFFNHALSGGGLTDYLALYDLYRQHQFAPKLIVLEVSPWVLNPAYASIWEDRYPPRRDLEQALLRDHGRPVAAGLHLGRSITRLKEIISPGYFQTSIMTWVLKLRRGSAIQETYRPFAAGDIPVMETFLSDGSVVYPESATTDRDRQQLRIQALAYAEGTTSQVPARIDPDRRRLLEAFIRQLQQNGAQVVLYLPPYHPTTYEHMLTSPVNAMLPEVERAFREIAAATGSDTIGSYDPHAIGFTDEDFFDPSHPNADAIARLFASRWNHEAVSPASGVQLAGLTNPNGLETVNGKPFFWIGAGTTCATLKASAPGWARVSFTAQPGPSLPETPRRRLLVSAKAGHRPQVLTVDGTQRVSVVVAVDTGLNEACFTPLDRPTVTRMSNGDTRPLLIGASEPRVEPAPAAAEPPASPCRVAFGPGWYESEADGRNWHRWMSGPARLTITTPSAGHAILTGETVAMTRPDRVDIRVGNDPAGAFDIPAGEWAFRPFGPITIAVPPGESTILLQPTNPPVTQPTDPRRLTIAIQNLHVVLNDAMVPCDLQP